MINTVSNEALDWLAGGLLFGNTALLDEKNDSRTFRKGSRNKTGASECLESIRVLGSIYLRSPLTRFPSCTQVSHYIVPSLEPV